MSAMIPGALAVIYALAVARVTRLITDDRLTETPRGRLSSWLWWRSWWGRRGGYYRREYGDTAEATAREDLANLRSSLDVPLPVYLLTCRWCASVYVGAVAAPIAYWWGTAPWFLVPALALAFSYVTGWLAAKE